MNVKKYGGENIIVEADESKFGKRKYHRGRLVEGVWVIGVVERTENRKILLFPVENRNMDTICDIFNNYVHDKSLVYSDGWPGYNSLQDHDYIHSRVNHSLHFVDPVTRVHTNTIEGNWSAIKAQIPKRYRTKKLIRLYLLMFMIKRNYKMDVVEYFIKNLK